MQKRTERAPLDDYPTPSWQTRLLLRYVTPVGRILEPCAGEGAMVRVLREELEPSEGLGKATVVGNDINRSGYTVDHHWYAYGLCRWDAATPRFWKCVDEYVDPDWVITNPPFKAAMEILQHAYEAATHGVALILRSTFMEPVRKRADWLAAHPPDLRIVMPRTQYRPPSKDFTTTEWACWLKTNKARGTIVVPQEEAGID